MNVPFVDLKAQYADIQEAIDKDVLDVLHSCYYVGGPHVKAFEEELGDYLHTDHVVGVASGTDALTLALRCLDRKPSRNLVIVPCNTFIASVFAVVHAGFTPIFVGVDPDTYLIDPDAVKAALNANPGKVHAVMAVDLYGQLADYQRLTPLCWAHDVWIVEDAAQAIGASHAQDWLGGK